MENGAPKDKGARVPAVRAKSGSREKGAGVEKVKGGERTKAAILRAATKEFSQHGLAGARIERIIADAKCNIRMLYHHFGSKELLYQTVLSNAYNELRAHEARIVDDLTDPIGCLDRLLRATFEYFEKNPRFEGLLRSENVLRARVLRRLPVIPEAAATTRKRIETIIAAGEASGVMRPGLDAEQLHVTIMALCLFHLSNSATISVLLDADTRGADWRDARKEHVATLLISYVSGSESR